MIRVVLPFHLRNLARIDGEVQLDLDGDKPVTMGAVLWTWNSCVLVVLRPASSPAVHETVWSPSPVTATSPFTIAADAPSTVHERPARLVSAALTWTVGIEL